MIHKPASIRVGGSSTPNLLNTKITLNSFMTEAVII